MATKPKKMWVRRPLVQYFGKIDTHGKQTPVAGVVHTTESHDYDGITDITGIVNYWRTQGQGLGAHIIIDKDGNSALNAPLDQIAWAVANHNTGRIHVELVGFAKFVPQIWWLRLSQLNKLAKWMAYINLEYGIPLEFSVAKGWAGHRDYPAQDHTDPGRWFPMKYVLRKANEYRNNGWT